MREGRINTIKTQVDELHSRANTTFYSGSIVAWQHDCYHASDSGGIICTLDIGVFIQVELPHDREGWARAVVSPAGMPLADHIAIKETGVMLAVRIVVGCEILKALDHLENVGLRILVQRRDAA